MRYEIFLAPEAVADIKRLRASLRAAIRDAIEEHLRNQPTLLSRSRIKRLRGTARPHYRLRVGDARVFYDVVGHSVEVLAVVPKSEANRWLRETGERQ